MSRRRNFYHFPCNPIDLGFILDIQSNNLPSVVSDEDRYTSGSISFILPTRSLISSMRLGLLRGTMKRKNFRITGFIAGVPFSSAKYISHLAVMFSDVQQHFRYPCFFQLCVEKQNRRKGIGSNLINQLQFETKRQQFEALITDVDIGNVPGRLFLEKQKFSQLYAPLCNDRLIFYKPLKTAS